MTIPRASGILLHPTSLPGPHGSGDLGASAYQFVDWLVASGQGLWQILPLGGLGPGNSPYMSTSAFAGNVLLIDFAELVRRGWLDDGDLATAHAFDARRVDYAAVAPWRMERLRRAAERFESSASAHERESMRAFCDEHADWLDDHALFMALADHHGWQAWCDWPRELARREPAALQQARERHAAGVAFWKFCQWRFFDQWLRLRAYANERGVRIVGDAPIFIAYQSAEVWAHQELFELDGDGRATVVAGVPPDYFSQTGQLWGNPLYRWSRHARDGYAWWIERIRRIFQTVDIVRIDHFRGFEAYWEIPAGESTAVNGRWKPGPGKALFEAIATALGPLKVIAEDLGLITPEVEALRRDAGLPGMRVLQFAFGDDHRNPYLPHNYRQDTVVYTGTHDNDTSRGWWTQASERERAHVVAYLGSSEPGDEELPWSLIRLAFASVADMAVVPLQDVLALGSEARMNRPGSGEGCWEWRFEWQQLQPAHAYRLAHLGRLYGRAAPRSQG
jgi:4-alpha-glucanotransferase